MHDVLACISGAYSSSYIILQAIVEKRLSPRTVCGTKTYKVAFWMRKYGSMSWKRTWVWSSSDTIKALDLGSLTKDEKQTSGTLTTRYKDSKGTTRFKGNKHLKTSQYLASKTKHTFLTVFGVLKSCELISNFFLECQRASLKTSPSSQLALAVSIQGAIHTNLQRNWCAWCQKPGMKARSDLCLWRPTTKLNNRWTC